MTDLDAPVREPSRARATFSTEASRPLRAAVFAHPRDPAVQDGPDPVRYSNPYHRLGRTG